MDFNNSGVALATALDISKHFDRVKMLVFFTNPSLIKCQLRYLALFRLFSLNITILQVVLLRKSSQESSVKARVLQGSIFGLTLFPLYINGLLDAILLSMLMKTTLYSR